MTGDGFAGRSTRATLHASFVEGRTYGSCLFLVVPGVPDARSHQTHPTMGVPDAPVAQSSCPTRHETDNCRRVVAGAQGGQSARHVRGCLDPSSCADWTPFLNLEARILAVSAVPSRMSWPSVN